MPLSPYLIGVNHFNSDVEGKDADRAWGRMREAKFRLIRIGGISNNDKTPSPEEHARWVDSIRAIGAEPLIQVSSIDPPAVAANLVRRLNMERKYRVRYWSIGNEPSCYAPTTAAQLSAMAANIKQRAMAMRAVDPSIKILIGDECYWKPDFYDPLIGGAHDVTGGVDGVRYIDGITFHSYPLPGDGRESKYTRNDVIWGAVPNMREQLRKCRLRAARADSLHGRTGEARLSISLTEFHVTYWNSSDNTPAGVGVRSFLAGQFVAEVFAMGMENGALSVMPWSMLETGGDGRPGDLGLFDGVGSVVPRPSYHHIKMIADNMAGVYAPTSVEGSDLLRALATQDRDTAAVMVLNQNLAAGVRFRLRFRARGAVSVAGPTVHIDAGWESEMTDSVPAQSTLLLKVTRSGFMFRRTVYSLAMAERYEWPTVRTFTMPTGMGAGMDAEGLVPILDRQELRGKVAPEGPYQAVLADVRGLVVSRVAGTGRRWSLSTVGLPAGLYFLDLRYGKKRAGRRIVLPPGP